MDTSQSNRGTRRHHLRYGLSRIRIQGGVCYSHPISLAYSKGLEVNNSLVRLAISGALISDLNIRNSKDFRFLPSSKGTTMPLHDV